MKTIEIKCPAKINLNLKITGRREDGFHNIESIMQTINLFDYLTISVEDNDKNEINLTGNSNEIPYDEHNLVYKAAKLFLEKTKIKNKKIIINIEKNIPVSAGLAGGSTDGAGTIFGLNEIFDKYLSHTELHKLCTLLGSDLNVCLKGGRIFAKGRGEIIEPLDFEEFNVSLIKPLNLGISAKEAYTKYSQKIKNLNELPPTAAMQPLLPESGQINSEDISPLSGGNGQSPKGVRLYPYIKNFSRNMRKQMTSQEVKLWQYIRRKQLGIKFRRQHPINNKYIADFACPEYKLIIELDGSQHIESLSDSFRTYYLENNGYRIVRFYNNDIDNNIEGCIEYLRNIIKTIPPMALRATSPSKGEDNVDNICPLSGGNGQSPKGVDNYFDNDLEWAVIDDYKELQFIKEKYPKSVMTGSGSTYFLIGDEFENEKDFWVKNNLKSIDYGICIA